MESKTLVIALIALLIGLGGGYVAAGANRPAADEHLMWDGAVMHNTSMGMGSAMDEMMRGLAGKTGDDFDKAFLAEMIMHHQGAVEMAEAALQYAKHTEIQDMARAIISAQTAEIEQMQRWQESWYGAR